MARKLQFNPSGSSLEPQLGIRAIISPEENENFRVKFYELQDKFLIERQKSIESYEKQNILKDSIIDFLEEPNNSTGQKLLEHFPSERQQKVVHKFIGLAEDIEFAETTLR